MERKIGNSPKIDPRLIGCAGHVPHAMTNDANRGFMGYSHFGDHLAIRNGEEKLMQSGLEFQLCDANANKYLQNDSRILNVIPKYSKSFGDRESAVSLTVIYYDIIERVYGELVIKRFDSYGSFFGFRLTWTDLLLNLRPGQIVKGGEFLAVTPTTRPNKGFAFGVLVNIATMTLNEVGEDAIVMSEDCVKRFAFNGYSKFSFSFGGDTVPVNLYGDEENFKAFPDIGEPLNSDNLLFATRKIDYTDCLSMSTEGMQVPDLIFDNLGFTKIAGAKVVDVEVVRIDKGSKSITYTHTTEQVDRYADELKKYQQELISEYNRILETEYGEIKLDAPFTKLLTDALIRTGSYTGKYKNATMDNYTVEITVEFDITPTVGFKFTGLHGDKGVLSGVRPKNKMPVDIYGNYADVIIEPSTLPSRMNTGKVHETFINGVSRKVKGMVTDMVNGRDINTIDSKEFQTIFAPILKTLEIIGTPQFERYRDLPEYQQRERLAVIIETEFYIHITVEHTNDPYISQNLQEAGLSYKKDRVWIDGYGSELSEEPVAILPQYYMALSKIADDFLSATSSNTNHFDVPVGASGVKRSFRPYNTNPTRTTGESETRPLLGTIGPEATYSLKAMAVDSKISASVCELILSAENPVDIKRCVDRSKTPFGEDAISKIVHTTLRTGGVAMEYKKG